MKNPTKLEWRGSDTYTDGTPYADAQRRGYDIGFKPKATPDAPYEPLLSVQDQGDIQQAFVSDIDATRLQNGVTYLVAVRDVSSTGMPSDWSAAVEVEFDRKPNPPTLTVS
jgi:hypothetical protein